MAVKTATAGAVLLGLPVALAVDVPLLAARFLQRVAPQARFSAGALAWVAAEGTGARPLIFWALAINAILNIAWSGIFFKMKRPDWALVEVAMLWLSILSLILVLGSYSTIAGLLMLPYLAWVSTAMFLNYRIVQMNKPFA